MTSPNSGEFVLQTLLEQFTTVAHKKIERALEDKHEPSLAKCLHHNDDPEFDQLLACLQSCSENSLPSILSAMFDWHSLQHSAGLLSAKRRKFHTNLAKSQSLQHHYRHHSADEEVAIPAVNMNLPGQSQSLGPGVVPPSSGGGGTSSGMDSGSGGGSSITLGLSSPMSSGAGSTAMLQTQQSSGTGSGSTTSGGAGSGLVSTTLTPAVTSATTLPGVSASTVSTISSTASAATTSTNVAGSGANSASSGVASDQSAAATVSGASVGAPAGSSTGASSGPTQTNSSAGGGVIGVTAVQSNIPSSGGGSDWAPSTAYATPTSSANVHHLSSSEKEVLLEKRDLAVDYIFCQVLVEILKQLPYHPGHENAVNIILQQSFTHFKYKEDLQTSQNGSSINQVADMYAEVVGVLASTRFALVRKKFNDDLKDLRSKDTSPFNTHSIISLLMGMKFFRVKMHPIEDFVACFNFLQELAHYFNEVKEKAIKHALAGLFVEILLPVGAVVKNEVNIPALKNFVDLLYTSCIDMATKKKHTLALFPMVTCLLCVGQKAFFLNNWPYFMTMCLSHLKNRDSKISRVSLESLFRLLWVYIVRIKCEKHTETQSKLQSIVNSLFPKGSKMVMPRDAPINIFVKIIQFIAQEKLDFAMKEIIFDLIGVNRPQKIIMPERMNIGLCAFLLIAHGLQQKEGEPPMPQGQLAGIGPGQGGVEGGTMRVKRSFHGSTLTDATASSLGIQPYLPQVRRAFDGILRQLDAQVCRPMLLTKQENANKEVDDVIPAERKPKLDLLKTCVASIPRLLPEEMSKLELVELLSRLNLHVDEELRTMAQQAMNNLVMEFPAWRQKIIQGFIQFIHKEISDTSPQQLDSCLKMLYHLLVNWKAGLQKDGGAVSAAKVEKNALHEAEGFALVMLCHCRPVTRRIATHILREVRTILSLTGLAKDDYPCCIDVMDRAAPTVLDRVLMHLPTTERNALIGLHSVDFWTLAERNSSCWVAGQHDLEKSSSAILSSPCRDPWVTCLSTVLNSDHLLTACPSALKYAWPIVFERISLLFPYIDPNAQMNENRTSLLRPGNKKPTNERDLHLHLWHNYVVFSCAVAPSSTGVRVDSRRNKTSPEHVGNHADNVDKSYESKFVSTSNVKANARELVKLLVPLLRCEQTDPRNTVVNGLGCINPAAFRDVLEDLQPLMKEAVDRKQENLRRRRRKDGLRLHLIRIFEMMAQNDVFAHSESGVINQHRQLIPQLVEYLQGMRLYLESDNQDAQHLAETKLHYCGFIKEIIRHMPKEKRAGLLNDSFRSNHFNLITQWSGKLGRVFNTGDDRAYAETPLRRSNDKTNQRKEEGCSDLEFMACKGMSALLCCGPIFGVQTLGEDCRICVWLNQLLHSHEDKIYHLAEETIILLLDLNSDSQALLEWVIDRCYTCSSQVVKACFQALVKTFNNNPEYPCDHVAMINVSLLFTSCPDILIRDKALQLLQLLYHRFFVEQPMVCTEGHSDTNKAHEAQNNIWKKIPKWTQMEISRQLAINHPDFTMPIFSEVTLRFETATPHIRTSLLSYLLPWISNLELVDGVGSSSATSAPTPEPTTASVVWQDQVYPSGQQPSGAHSGRTRGGSMRRTTPADEGDHGGDGGVDLSPMLKGCGWGSKQATELVLNNLFYMTVKFGYEHSPELERLWSVIVRYRHNNLKIIIRYLIIITSLAPNDLLSHAKRVIVFLGNAKGERLADELMLELQTIDGIGFTVERTQTPPFFRLTANRQTKTFNSDDNGPGNSNTGSSFISAFTTSSKATPEFKTQKSAPLTDRDAEASWRWTSATSDDAKGDSSKLGDSDDPVETNKEQFQNAFAQSAPGSLRTKIEVSRDAHSDEELNDGVDESDKYATLRARHGSDSPHRPSIMKPPSPIISGWTAKDAPLSQGSEVINEEELPHPLPMPAYGGYYAPLQTYLPDQTLAWVAFYRSSVVLMLVSELVVCVSVNIDWNAHLPLLLHCLVLGMDHSKELVHEECKQLLLNLFRTLCPQLDQFRVASILLNSTQPEYSLSVDGGPCQDLIRRGVAEEPTMGITALHRTVSSFSLTSTTTLTPDTMHAKTLPELDNLHCLADVARAIAEFILSRKGKPLWQWEEICVSRTQPSTSGSSSSVPGFQSSTSAPSFSNTGFGPPLSAPTSFTPPSCGPASLKSTRELTAMVQYVCRVMAETGGGRSGVEQRWCQLALNTALSCSSRHYAARSLQVYRALRMPLTGPRLAEILSRLIETLAEQTEDIQGYVTELLLTLESAIDNLNGHVTQGKGLSSTGEVAEGKGDSSVCQSTPNLNQSGSNEAPHWTPSHQPMRRIGAVPNSLMGPWAHNASTSAANNSAATPSTVQPSPNTTPDLNVHHARSTSCTAGALSGGNRRRTETLNPTTSGANSGLSVSGRPRPRTMTEAELGSRLYKTGLTRSRSNQSMEHPELLNEEDKANLLLKLFWVSVFLLDSDYEYEYQGALRLLDKLLNHIQLDDHVTRDKMDKMLSQINWAPSFPGVLHLLLKGCANANLCEQTWRLLSRLMVYITSPVVDPSQSMGFPIAVLAVLPHLVNSYEIRPRQPACVLTADNVASTAAQLAPDELANLATVMHLYSASAFTKDASQWTKCVIRYLLDVYANLATHLLEYLTKMLCLGPPCVQGPLMQMIFCFMHYVDHNSINLRHQAQELYNALIKQFVNTVHWNKVVKILKLIVSKASVLTAPSPDSLRPDYEVPLVPLPEAEMPRLELPGRTLDFKFNMSSVAWVGEHLLAPGGSAGSKTGAHHHLGIIGGDGSEVPAWKRPWTCQTRIRERLVQLLSSYGTCGYRIGLPKSPSVIFSQSTETLDRQLSMHSSSETTSTNDVSNVDDLRMDDTSSVEQAQVFRDLDLYLDAQMQINFLGDDTWEDDHKPPWGVRRHSITHHRDFHTAAEDGEDNDPDQTRLDDSSISGPMGASPGLETPSPGTSFKQRTFRTTPEDTADHPGSPSQGPNMANNSGYRRPFSLTGDDFDGSRTDKTPEMLRRMVSESPSLMLQSRSHRPSASSGGQEEQPCRMITSYSASMLENMAGTRGENRPISAIKEAAVHDRRRRSLGLGGNSQRISASSARDETSEEEWSGGDSSSCVEQDVQVTVKHKKKSVRSGIRSSVMRGGGAVGGSSSMPAGRSVRQFQMFSSSGPPVARHGEREPVGPGASSPDDDPDEEEEESCGEDDEIIGGEMRGHRSLMEGKVVLRGGRMQGSWQMTPDPIKYMTLDRNSSLEAEVEAQWLNQMTDVAGRGTPLSRPVFQSLPAVLTLFPRAYREICAKSKSLTKEANYYLGKLSTHQPMTELFSQLMELISTEIECPFIFVDSDLIRENPTKVQRIKSSIMQLHETYETFNMRKERADQCLTFVKNNIHLDVLDNMEPVIDESPTDLCRYLHKMYTHLLMLFESHMKVMTAVCSLLQPLAHTNLSNKVGRIAPELSRCLATPEPIRSSLTRDSVSSSSALKLEATKTGIEDQLFAEMTEGNYDRVVQIWRRAKRTTKFFNTSGDADELATILLIYCNQIARDNPNLFVFVEVNRSMEDVSADVMDMLLDMSSKMSELEEETRSTRVTQSDTADSSIL